MAIYTMEECKAAAVYMGLLNTNPAYDDMVHDINQDPPFCYYRYGLRFNPGTNGGTCSAQSKCICSNVYTLISHTDASFALSKSLIVVLAICLTKVWAL